ncbi:GspH/FimT family pseudopilin [Amphritea atlantica]|nr:GspH/FimT family pseudopilin [Amphritea atlantica]
MLKMKQTGFTLIELMVTIAIASILLMLATADYGPMLRANQLTSEINQMLGGLSYARTESGKLTTTVTVCSSTDGVSCNGGGLWERGWIIFNDQDSDAVLDAGDGDRIQRVFPALTSGETIRRTGFSFPEGRLQFNARGELRGSNAQPGSMIICSQTADVAEAKALVINISGSVRKAVDEDDDGVVNQHSGGNVTCP